LRRAVGTRGRKEIRGHKARLARKVPKAFRVCPAHKARRDLKVLRARKALLGRKALRAHKALQGRRALLGRRETRAKPVPSTCALLKAVATFHVMARKRWCRSSAPLAVRRMVQSAPPEAQSDCA
jgi:hypothetical protein